MPFPIQRSSIPCEAIEGAWYCWSVHVVLMRSLWSGVGVGPTFVSSVNKDFVIVLESVCMCLDVQCAMDVAYLLLVAVNR